jgi:uncharacterized membrane protein
MAALSIYSAASQGSDVPRGYFWWSLLLGLIAIFGSVLFFAVGYTRRYNFTTFRMLYIHSLILVRHHFARALARSLFLSFSAVTHSIQSFITIHIIVFVLMHIYC